MVSSSTATTAIVLLDLAVIIATGSVLAKVVARCGQPAVVGEIIAGIVLGPTLLGRLPGHLTTHLFPVEARPFLNVLADVGLYRAAFSFGRCYGLAEFGGVTVRARRRAGLPAVSS
jgi:Kef-type K+ transport system membrane component KefB